MTAPVDMRLAVVGFPTVEVDTGRGGWDRSTLRIPRLLKPSLACWTAVYWVRLRKRLTADGGQEEERDWVLPMR